jgi:DNA polymerase-1
VLSRITSTRPPVRRSAKTYKGVAGGIYTLVDTKPLLEDLLHELLIKKQFACDTETTGLHFVNSDIVGFSFSWSAEHSYYLPIRHESGEKQLKPRDVIPGLKEVFEREDLTTIWHNAKFDLHFLWKEGILPKGVVHDTLLLHKLLDEISSGRLKDIAQKEVHPEANMWEDMVEDFRTKKGRERIPAPLPGKPNRKVARKKGNVHYGMVPLDIMTPYAASDTHYTWHIFKDKFLRVAEDPDLRQLYIMESQLLWILLGMEHLGVWIDVDYLREKAPELEEEISEYRQTILAKLDNYNCNIDSNKELTEQLLKMGLRWRKRTNSGAPSLDAEVLKGLAANHDVCQDVLDYRAAKKLKSTYVDNISSKVDEEGFLHCSYNQSVVTGRMSSSDPNLQNIPARHAIIRKAFACPDDYVMVFIDYSQVEVRMTAHYSQDPVLVKAYTQKPYRDVHTNTMCEVFDYDYQEAVSILKDDSHQHHKEFSLMRKVAKLTNFLVIYGGGAENLRVQISSPERQFSKRECETFINKYFLRLKVLKRWINKTKLLARRQLQVQNYFGRYRRFPELENADARLHVGSEKWKIARAERQAVNFLIQGTCADLFKQAMVRVGNILEPTRSRIIMAIHDEIVMYIHREELSILAEVKEEMERWDFSVPIVADVCYSNSSWADKKELHL